MAHTWSQGPSGSPRPTDAKSSTRTRWRCAAAAIRATSPSATARSPIDAMNALTDQLSRWERHGDLIAIATVVGAKHSAPRPLGTKMAINELGEIAGGVSGGCVEGAVVQIAERVMHRGEPELTTFGIADDEAWGIGLPCGGEID